LYLSTKESLNRERVKYAKIEKGKGVFPKWKEEIFAAKYHCVECMF